MPVKVCGVTQPDQARSIAELGAAAIGLVFVKRSPRSLSPREAVAIISALPPFIQTVGLFLDAEPREVNETLAAVPLNLLQFHGNETADYCRQFHRPYIKAVAMADGPNLDATAQAHANARALLLDAHRVGQLGGRGVAFDWDAVPAACPRPIVLAGGLNPDNVAEAIRRVRPAAVDVSSGIETQPGVKDLDRVRQFLAEVEGATTT